jgi:hypothetical protein
VLIGIFVALTNDYKNRLSLKDTSNTPNSNVRSSATQSLAKIMCKKLLDTVQESSTAKLISSFTEHQLDNNAEFMPRDTKYDKLINLLGAAFTEATFKLKLPGVHIFRTTVLVFCIRHLSSCSLAADSNLLLQS